MKIGQWARGYAIRDKKMVIGKIAVIDYVFNAIKISGYDWCMVKIKTTDKLEDLIEVGDLIEYNGVDSSVWSTIICSDLHLQTIKINRHDIELTKIIPHENLQWQTIKKED